MAVALDIPQDVETYQVKCGQKTLTFTNLQKVFWPGLNKTKRDLLIYYAAVSEALLPHLRNRCLTMSRYPDGLDGKSITVKKVPIYYPCWLKTYPSERFPAEVTDIPVIQDLASLLWIVNLGCIEFFPSPAYCDDIERPDYISFDLEPISPAEFPQAQTAALLVQNYLQEKNVKGYAKTNGSRGIHIYIPIYRKAYLREVWIAAKQIAHTITQRDPALFTSEYLTRKRLPGQVLINYNQNSGKRLLSSVYSLCPNPQATVSAPVSWEELKEKIGASEFTIDTVPSRLERIGDLFRPLLRPASRYPLEALL